MIYGAEQSAQAQSLSEQWQQDYEATPDPEPSDDTDADDGEPAEPPIIAPPGDAEVFATMYVPRFGPDYGVQIAGGTTRARTLDPIGIGHYNGTAMPGELGNVALAAHRTTYGAPFNRIADLHVGDAIVVETAEGWFTYRFRTLEYVTPQAVDVLLPVPQEDGIEANGKYMTLTSCSPMYDLTERIVAYAVFDSFTPRGDGPPASLSEGLI